MSKPNEWKLAAATRRTRGLIGNELLSLIEIYDDISVAAHLVNIMRSKGKIIGQKRNGEDKYRDPYYIKDEEFLKDLEAYKADLQNPKEDEE